MKINLSETLVLHKTDDYNEAEEFYVPGIKELTKVARLKDGDWGKIITYDLPVNLEDPTRFALYNAMLTHLGFQTDVKIDKNNGCYLTYELTLKNLISANPHLPKFFIDYYISGRYHTDKYTRKEFFLKDGQLNEKTINEINFESHRYKNTPFFTNDKPFFTISDINYQDEKDIEKVFAQIYEKLGDTPHYITELKTNPVYRLINEVIVKAHCKKRGYPLPDKSEIDNEFNKMVIRAENWAKKYRNVFKLDGNKPLRLMKLDIDNSLQKLYERNAIQGHFENNVFSDQFDERMKVIKKSLRTLYKSNIDFKSALDMVANPWLDAYNNMPYSHEFFYLSYQYRAEKVYKEFMSSKEKKDKNDEYSASQQHNTLKMLNSFKVRACDNEKSK